MATRNKILRVVAMPGANGTVTIFDESATGELGSIGGGTPVKFITDVYCDVPFTITKKKTIGSSTTARTEETSPTFPANTANHYTAPLDAGKDLYTLTVVGTPTVFEISSCVSDDPEDGE